VPWDKSLFDTIIGRPDRFGLIADAIASDRHNRMAKTNFGLGWADSFKRPQAIVYQTRR
jgi:hypothetical protein